MGHDSVQFTIKTCACKVHHEILRPMGQDVTRPTRSGAQGCSSAQGRNLQNDPATPGPWNPMAQKGRLEHRLPWGCWYDGPPQKADLIGETMALGTAVLLR